MNSLIIKKVLPYLSVIIVTSACSKILDTTPELYVSEDVSVIDKKSAESALTGAYNALSQNSYQGNTFRYIANLADDNIKWVGNSPTNREFDVYGVFATNSRVSELWAAIYKTINISNNIIEAVPAINDLTFSQADRDKSRGEAYFLRAYSYFDLVRLWGNVPIQVKRTKTSSDGDKIGNSTPAEVYQQVKRDLDSAENLLPAVINRNRANKYTAKALKARLFLYLQDWDNAEAYATEIINNPGFALGSSYSQFFTSKNTSESIFEIDYTVNNSNTWATNWFASNITGGKREFLPTDAFIALAGNPDIGGSRSALLLTINGVTYGNMNFKIATGDDQVYAIRLAELYLIRAEARAEKAVPDIDGGLKDLNKIRVRANVPAIDAIADKDELVDKILQERRIELAYESHRWFDLVRKGKAQSVLGITDANKLVLPIPKQQILVNPSLVQNPGYN
jgi:hypothetical protein